jgi:Domain of unknown function (DUF4864)/Domain of unknown function (DUF5658)
MSSEERGWVKLFLYLQVLDLLSTLIGFSLGNAEASPFIRMLVRWGPVTGLVVSKLVAVGLVGVCFALKRTRLIQLVNIWYAVLVIWNLYIVLTVLNGPPNPQAAAEPGEAIQKVAAALRHNNEPIPNAGIFTAYQFASPQNHASTGKYGQFLMLVRSADYAPMLRDHPQELGPLEVRGDRAEQILRIRDGDGREHVYRFAVVKQADRGWMVDGVGRE